MKGREIVLGRIFGQEAAALMQDGQLVDLLVAPDAITDLAPGAICRATVGRFMKGQGGVFLRLPNGASGYLRERRGLTEGGSILVQISGVAEEGKAIPVSNKLIFRGALALVTPGAAGINVSRRIRETARREELEQLGRDAMGERAYGAILRSAAEGADDDDIAAEIAELAGLADQILADADGGPELLLDAPSPHELAALDWNDPQPDSVEEGDDSFERCNVLDAVDELLSPRIALPGGGHAWIETTRALTAIDVNTGADSSPAAGLKANIALARDLPRQLALRGIGGQIAVDFAPMPKRDRATLDQVMQSVFRQSGAEATLLGWTAMGLFEMTRKRDRVALSLLASGQG
ncbi:ribonuclease E/G [Paracoccus sp. PARArs4]|uniref:ribonuclease E/G n=1 Tax=Paracoccus sp. PARArs4 TaxID=2853442 RepID=UPI0024A73EE6|nr:ribonuclease E/G [Paracoccus sp. PARArs4]